MVNQSPPFSLTNTDSKRLCTVPTFPVPGMCEQHCFLKPNKTKKKLPRAPLNTRTDKSGTGAPTVLYCVDCTIYCLCCLSMSYLQTAVLSMCLFSSVLIDCMKPTDCLCMHYSIPHCSTLFWWCYQTTFELDLYNVYILLWLTSLVCRLHEYSSFRRTAIP